MAVAQASLLQSFPFRAAVFAACVLLLPLVPSPQAPAAGGDGGGGGGRGEAFLAKVWELLHLLVVGIAVSYGLFSRRNDAGRRGDEKDAAAQAKADSAGYVSQMIHDSLVFDDGGGDVALDSPGGNRVRSWSAMHHPDEPVVVVATGGAGGGRSHAVEAAQQAPPLSLPVRTLKPQGESSSSAGYGDGGEPWRRGRAGSHRTRPAEAAAAMKPCSLRRSRGGHGRGGSTRRRRAPLRRRRRGSPRRRPCPRRH